MQVWNEFYLISEDDLQKDTRTPRTPGSNGRTFNDLHTIDRNKIQKT
jgi:hypothetical protein